MPYNGMNGKFVNRGNLNPLSPGPLYIFLNKIALTCIPLGGGELMQELGEGNPPDDIPGESGPAVLT